MPSVVSKKLPRVSKCAMPENGACHSNQMDEPPGLPLIGSPDSKPAPKLSALAESPSGLKSGNVREPRAEKASLTGAKFTFVVFNGAFELRRTPAESYTTARYTPESEGCTLVMVRLASNGVTLFDVMKNALVMFAPLRR